MTDAVLQCPKCGAGMVSFQRGGIPVDECAACRGVFLGRRDLERLLGRGAVLAAVGNAPGMAPAYEGRHRRD
ncbi:MAG: zf-TFIIB domain-containing protein [Gaiellaceae bacterium]